VLRGLVDTVLANRKLFVLHQRNQTALSGLHIKGHEGDHEEIEQQFRHILSDPAIPARDRIRLGCALGALLSILMSVGDLADLSPEVYGDLLREAITDLLEPRTVRRKRTSLSRTALALLPGGPSAVACWSGR
jgi:hypothetical protein